MDDDIDQDDAKRKSRNLSEKKRRDQFNLLVNELNSMVFSANRKLDKSTVLQTTIAFLKQQDEKTAQSRVHEIQENWKPSFLSNEEFTHLMLEAVSGFIIVLSSNGQIQYASESIITLMGHLPSDLVGTPIYDLIYEKENQEIYSVLSNPTAVIDPLRNSLSTENQVCFSCYLKKGGLKGTDEVVYEQVQFVGFFRYDVQSEEEMPSTSYAINYHESGVEPKLLFVGIGRLQTPQLVREMSAIDSTKSEFTSRQSLEWKFLFLDHRATPIIGYLPFEVLGTSGYDYYHFDDLDNIANDQEALMMKGGGTSCYYRFLTKSQQWIWLQTHSYLTYHQWTSKPEFVVCTHRVFSYAEVLRQQNCDKRETTNKNKSKKPARDELLKADVINKRSNTKVDMNKNVGSSPSPSRSVDSSRRDAKRIKSNTPSESSQSQARIQTRYSTSHERDRDTFEQSPSSVINSQQLTETINTLQTSQTLSPSYAGTFQHAANIPVQFVMSTDVHSPVVPPLQHNVVMSSSQSQIQSQLQKKHEELQQAIYEQQRELQRVSEQLHMARYGPSSILNVPNFPEIQAPYFVGSVDSNIDQSIIRHVNLIGVDQYSNDTDYQNRRNPENQINASNAGTSDVHLENVNDHMPRVVVLQDEHYREFPHSHQQWTNDNAQPPIQDEKNCSLITNDNHLMQKSAVNIVNVHSPVVTDSQSVDNSSIDK